MIEVHLFDLWLPIVISAVICFIASAVLHTVLPFHRKDVQGVPDENAFLDFLRSRGVRPGMYIFPYCADLKDLKDPDKKAKYLEGPHGFMSIWHGPPPMPKNLALTFLLYLVVGLFVAYLTTEARFAGASYLSVFQVAGTVAILAYCVGFVHIDIWYKRPLRNTLLDVMDGIILGLLTAGTFACLWPSGATGGLPT